MLEKFPGLYPEKRPSGEVRHRVRPADGSKKITLLVGPDHPMFNEHYHAARAGVQLALTEAKGDTAKRGTVGWLIDAYATAMDQMVGADLLLAKTAKYRMVHLNWLRGEVGEYPMDMPPNELMKLRDKKMKTPGAADNFLKAVRAMYKWAMPPRGIVSVDPSAGIRTLTRNAAGATPWTIADLMKFREAHPPGTTAHLALSLFMFTACRLGDVIRLGRQHETLANGVASLGWQPQKRGSAFVTVPMLPPLYEATRAVKVIGATTYLLTESGKPFSSNTSFGNKFRDWVREAGLVDGNGVVNRSPHGIRKATAELLALSDATQYEIMAVHGHSSPQTSAIYTKGAERAKLAASAMARLKEFVW